MSDTIATESTSRYLTRSVSLFPEQDAAVTAFAKDSGLENYSAALRMIINQWLRYEAEKHQRTLTPSN
jgi:hypothetical protein